MLAENRPLNRGKPSNSSCLQCGGALRVLDEDVSEVLEYVPEHWRVHRHVRPKYSCGSCQTIVQASAPSRPIERSYAGPALLAHVLVSKYCDHIPLYRQSQIYAREGLELDRATLAEWVGSVFTLVDPLLGALIDYVMGAEKLHADDTPIPVLAPVTDKTKTGRLWTYVRDDPPSGSTDRPAVVFRYSPDRKGERLQAHLHSFRGILQADGYAGFQASKAIRSPKRSVNRGGVLGARAPQVLRPACRHVLTGSSGGA